jgi:hypothetical protein
VPPRGRQRFLIVYAGLAEAVRRESAEAVMHCCGVSHQTVRTWRRALHVPRDNEGSTQLMREATAAHLPAAREAARPMLSSPERRQKISEANRGRVLSEESRAAIGKASKAGSTARRRAAR